MSEPITMRLADPSDRLAAQCIDSLLPSLPMIVLGLAGATLGRGTLMLLGAGLTLAASIAYLVLNLVLLHRHGQTYGKRRVGVRIVRTSGARVGLGRIFMLRMALPAVLSSIPVVGFPFMLLDALTIFSRDRKCVHDRFADTVVVDVRSTPEPAELKAA